MTMAAPLVVRGFTNAKKNKKQNCFGAKNAASQMNDQGQLGV
jgi:hypothetical protein